MKLPRISRLFVLLLSAAASCTTVTVKPRQVDALPRIWPDYTNVTVPAGIAPLNFSMADSAFVRMSVLVSGSKGGSLEIDAREEVQFPERKWHELLQANKDGMLSVIVCAKDAEGWKRFVPFCIYVSGDDCDYGLCYRLIPPGYVNWGHMRICERDLSSFRERTLVDNKGWRGCVNCHSFNRCSPDDFSFHVRGEHGATVLRSRGHLDAYNTRTDSTLGFCVYPYWHPGGDWIAYSSNTTRQHFHTTLDKLIEVFDIESDVYIYNVRSGRLHRPPLTSSRSMNESFPAFSADGRTLYFTAAPSDAALPVMQTRYNLYSVGFDPESGEVGGEQEPVVVVDAAALGKSVAHPRPSFDGRFLIYTLSDYGTFPVWHPESDLWILDLRSGKSRPLTEINSRTAADSYHNWSSNSRWLVFGSRRLDGAYTRPFIAHVDENGRCGKPFLLPQKSPRLYYLEQMNSYNIPEFVTGPVDFESRRTMDLILSPDRTPFL